MEPARRDTSLSVILVVLLLSATFSTTLAVFASPDSDYQWTFNNNGINDYRLTSVSSPNIYSDSLPADDPTINLILGKRYAVSVVNFTAHPFQVIAKGATAGSDVILLSQGATGGSSESDVEVNWVDTGTSTVEFTVTSGLISAMNQSGLNPGYRCGIHISTMRGDFQIFGNGVEITDPIPELIQKGSITIELETIMEGLASPLGIAVPDDGTDRIFVYDQAGTVSLILNGTPQGTPFLDVSSRLVTLNPGYDERGLLGFALHPDFASNGKVYSYTSEPVGAPADFTHPAGSTNHQGVIAEWTVDSINPNIIDMSTRRELLRIDEPQGNHNGGVLHFGPDGFLYIALGDGGGADDQAFGGSEDGHGADGNGQNKDTVLGTILRIDVDGNNSTNGQYGVPVDNPFAGTSGVDEILAYGFRNPYSFSFDRGTGDLYAADVGQNDIEEIDIVTTGGNYGWRLKEGSFFFDPNGTDSGFVTTEPVVPLPGNLIDPIAEYDHDEGSAVISGFVYRGTAISQLQGHYVCGDWGGFGEPSGRLFYIDDMGELAELIIGDDRSLGLWLKGFGQDLDGELYVLGSETLGPSGITGKLLKIIPLAPTPTPTPTPSPTPFHIIYDFISDTEGWTTGGATSVFSAPDFAWESDRLTLTSSTNTNTFGFWQSPQDAVPADSNYLYRARFNVFTDITDQAVVPWIRLRANSLNLQQYDILSIESAGDGAASPSTSRRDYDLYFVPPTNETAVILAFDLLNFNPFDAAVAELSLDAVHVDRFALDSLSIPTVVQDYTFELSEDGWTTGGAPVVFTPPDFIYSGGALELRATTNTNAFGFWGNHPADITIEADRLYRGTFEVRTDLTNPVQVPEMRLRFNTGNLQASHTFGIVSSGDAANSPGTTNTTYDRVYFLPPANSAGESLLVSFDILNFNPNDASEASLILDRAVIESLSPPALP